MAKSEQQRQRKLAKKKSKEKDGKKIAAQRQQQMSSLAGQMSLAAAGDIEHCYIASACHDGTGIGYVLLSRRIKSGQLAAAVFLVDAFCLGVKDAMGRYFTTTQIRDTIDQFNQRSPLESVSPGVARGYVEAAIEYARSLGFAPHGDYRKVSPLWGNIDPEPLPEKYQFGQSGMPHFVSGPFDDLHRQRLVVQTLVENVGEGNFHFSLGGPGLTNQIELLENATQWEAIDEIDDLEDDSVDGGTIEGVVTRRTAIAD